MSFKTERDEILKHAYIFYTLKGPKNFKIKEVFKKTDISKEKVLSFFESEVELLFEILDLRIKEKVNQIKQSLLGESNTKRKIEIFFSLYLSDSPEITQMRKNYEYFIKTDLSSKKKYFFIKERILNKVVKNLTTCFNENIKNDSFSCISSEKIRDLILTADAMLVYSFKNPTYNFKKEINDYINAIFEYILKRNREVKNEKS